jgi:glycosyltransferase involved in cell wall biosynthesis
MKNVYYWCPFIGNIATIKAVINSAYSLTKYSNKKFVPTIINSCGEWNEFNTILYEKKINLKNFKNLFKIETSTSGYLKSRITYIKIFISCFFSLKNTLKEDQPEYLIAHLITSLPIFLYSIFNFKTKLIIRVSGKVKMNILRKILWRFCQKNITLITCPTKETQKDIIKLNIVEEFKVIYLPDPIIEINEILKQKRNEVKDNILKEKFFIIVGRYTRQKNHLLAIKCFKKILEKYNDINLLIIGNGELKNEYIDVINNFDLNNRIRLIDYQKNIPNYLKKSLGLISSSLWEDPGFVMIEAAACNTFIISSDCSNGPKEFVGNENGLLFENNNIDSLEKNILKYLNMSSDEIVKKKIGAKKKSINFTKLRHFKILSKFLI